MEKPNILIVDDKEENLLSLEALLSDFEINIVKATSGREALGHILKNEFALILLDVAMPEMDGFETAKIIREKPSSEHTPIIFITAFGKSEEYALKGYSLGAVDYIGKPVIPEVLKAKISVFIDLFNIKEQLKHHVEMLSEINKELEAFTHSASHDLRNPLINIQGFCSVLLKYQTDKLDPQITHCIERIYAGVQRMDELITDLLALSRITKVEMKQEEVNLSKIAQEIADEYKEKEHERNIEFIISKDIIASGDRHLLKILLENLIGNSVKYTSKKDLTRIEFGEKKEDGKIVYFICDNGCGFDMAYVSQLFAPFSRLHGVSEFPGTGIGLSIVKRIVHRHNGKVWAEGKIDEGATIFFTF